MATISEILTAKGVIPASPQAIRAKEDERWRQAGARAKCTVTSRTGIARTVYARDEHAAWNEAYDLACNLGWNIPASTFATHRI